MSDLLNALDAAKDALTEARKKIAQGWTRGTKADDQSGRRVPPTHPDAVCWCMSGALEAVIDDPHVMKYARFRLIETKPSPPPDFVCPQGATVVSVEAINDWYLKDQADALAWIDRAIAREYP